jgi:hypothetical protein
MSSSKEPILGSLRAVSSTEDRILYEYRTPRRPARGAAYVLLAAALIGAGFKFGVDRSNLVVWLLCLVPLALSGVFLSWGLLDLITRGLFELEVDRRARTLALAMQTGHGQALAKIGFGDVSAVDLSERRPLPGVRGRTRWNVTLPLRDGRRIGLGLLEDAEEAGKLAAGFVDLLGVPLTRSVHESRGPA